MHFVLDYKRKLSRLMHDHCQNINNRTDCRSEDVYRTLKYFEHRNATGNDDTEIKEENVKGS